MPATRSSEATSVRRGAVVVPRQRTAEPPATAPESMPTGERWKSRPVAARLIQIVVLAVPVAASVGVAALVSGALPHAHHLIGALGWWSVVLVSSTVTMYAVDR